MCGWADEWLNGWLNGVWLSERTDIWLLVIFLAVDLLSLWGGLRSRNLFYFTIQEVNTTFPYH